MLCALSQRRLSSRETAIRLRLCIGVALLWLCGFAFSCTGEESADSGATPAQQQPTSPSDAKPRYTLVLNMIVREAGDRRSAYLFRHLMALQRIVQTHGTGEDDLREPDLARRFDDLVNELAERRQTLRDNVDEWIEQSKVVLAQRLRDAGFEGATIEALPAPTASDDVDGSRIDPQEFVPLSVQPLRTLRVRVPYGEGESAGRLVGPLTELLTRPGRVELHFEAHPSRHEAAEQLRPLATAEPHVRDANNPDPLRLRWMRMATVALPEAGERAWGHDEQGNAWILVDTHPEGPRFDQRVFADVPRPLANAERGSVDLEIAEAHLRSFVAWYNDANALNDAGAPLRLCVVVDDRVAWIGVPRIIMAANNEDASGTRLRLAASDAEALAAHLAEALNAGSLPMNLQVQRVQVEQDR